MPTSSYILSGRKMHKELWQAHFRELRDYVESLPLDKHIGVIDGRIEPDGFCVVRMAIWPKVGMLMTWGYRPEDAPELVDGCPVALLADRQTIRPFHYPTTP